MRSSTPQLRDTSRNPIAKAPSREQDYQTIVREEIPAAHNPYEYPHEALLTFQDENNNMFTMPGGHNDSLQHNMLSFGTI